MIPQSTVAQFYRSTEEALVFRYVFENRSFTGRVLRINIRERDTNTVKKTLNEAAGLTVSSSGDPFADFPDNQVAAQVSVADMDGWKTGEYEVDLLDVTNAGAPTRLVAGRVTMHEPGRMTYGVVGNEARVKVEENQAVITAVGGVGIPGPATNITIGDVETLPAGSDATAAISGDPPSLVLELGIPAGDTGATGDKAWSPIYAAEEDGNRRIFRLHDWVGGEGTKPPTMSGSDPLYLGAGGYTTVAGDATDMRGPIGDGGPIGQKGWSPLFAMVVDGERRVLQVQSWTGGEGTPPASGGYLGAAGIVVNIEDATDFRGESGAAAGPGTIGTTQLADDGVTTAKIDVDAWPGFVPTGKYAATDVGFSAAEGAAFGSSPHSRSLAVNSAIEMSASVNPRVPVRVANSGRLIRAATANMTFFDTFEAGRHEVFRDWPAANLSFKRGQDQFPEWHVPSMGVNDHVAIQKAHDCLNYSDVLFDNRDYMLGAADMNVNLTRNFCGMIGKGEVRTNFILTNGDTSSGFYLQGSEGSRLQRARLSDFTIVRPVDLVGVGLAFTIVNSTTITVTAPAHGFDSGDLNRRLLISAITGVTADPGSARIASIPDANTLTLTVTDYPGSGSGTLRLDAPRFGQGGNGVSLAWAHGARLANIQVDDTLIGFSLYRSGSCVLDRCLFNFEGDANGVIGFAWSGDGGGGGSLGNASTELNDCGVSRGPHALGTNAIGWKIDGTYVGDIVSRNFSSQFMTTSILVDTTTATPDTNGNADIIFETPKLDGFSTAGLHCKGNTDNMGMVSLLGGWLNSRGTPGARGVYQENHRRLLIQGVQFGIGGRTSECGWYALSSKDSRSVGSDYVDQQTGIIWDGAEDCASVGDHFYSTGNVSGGKHIVIKGSAKRCKVTHPQVGKGSLSASVVEIEAGCEDIEVIIGKVDTTNITGNVIIDAGTRTRIHLSGPATLATLSGSDTYLWCEPTGYAPAATAPGGTVAVSGAVWRQSGKMVTVNASMTISGAISSGITLALPKAYAGVATGSGRNASTGAPVYMSTTGSDKVIFFSAANGAPGADGDQIIFSFTYPAA